MPTPRVSPADPPYPPDVQARLDAIMPEGVEPLISFRTLARDPRLFERFMSAGLLDRGNLTLRQRELTILRTTARCRSEYEWGVHAAFFASRAGLSEAEIERTTATDPDPAAHWAAEDAAIVSLVDELCASATITDASWRRLREHYNELQTLELIMLVGFYHTVSFITNGLRLPCESFARRFAATDSTR